MRKGADPKDDCGCVACPRCSCLFTVRKHGCCPACGTRLVYPGEYFSLGGEGFYFGGGKWCKVSEAVRSKEDG